MRAHFNSTVFEGKMRMNARENMGMCIVAKKYENSIDVLIENTERSWLNYNNSSINTPSLLQRNVDVEYTNFFLSFFFLLFPFRFRIRIVSSIYKAAYIISWLGDTERIYVYNTLYNIQHIYTVCNATNILRRIQTMVVWFFNFWAYFPVFLHVSFSLCACLLCQYLLNHTIHKHTDSVHWITS